MRAVRRVSIVVLVLLAAGSLAWTQGPIEIPVPLEDPLGLGDGVPVQLEPAEPSSVERTRDPADAATAFAGTFPAGSDTIEMPAFGAADFPLGIPPSRLEIVARFGGSLTMHVPGSAEPQAFPAEVVLTGARIVTLRVEDASEDEPVVLGPFELASDVELGWRRADRCDASSCRYRASDRAEDASIRILVEGDRLDSVLAVLGNDHTPNRLTGRLTVTFDLGVPTDGSVDVVLMAPSGTAIF